MNKPVAALAIAMVQMNATKKITLGVITGRFIVGLRYYNCCKEQQYKVIVQEKGEQRSNEEASCLFKVEEGSKLNRDESFPFIPLIISLWL